MKEAATSTAAARPKAIVAPGAGDFVANLRAAGNGHSATQRRMASALQRAALRDDRPRDSLREQVLARQLGRHEQPVKQENAAAYLMPSKAERLRRAVESSLLEPENPDELLLTLDRAMGGDRDAQKTVVAYLKHRNVSEFLDAFA